MELRELKASAIKLGWDENFVNEVSNLEWSIKGLYNICYERKVTDNQRTVILFLYNAAKKHLVGI